MKNVIKDFELFSRAPMLLFLQRDFSIQIINALWVGCMALFKMLLEVVLVFECFTHAFGTCEFLVLYVNI